MKTTIDHNQHMTNFVVSNLKMLDSYDLEKIYKDLFNKKARKQIGVYFNDRGETEKLRLSKKCDGYFTSVNFALNYYESIEANEAQLSDELMKKGVTLEEFKNYDDFSYVFSSCYLRKDGEHYTISNEHSANSLINFMRFVVNGHTDENMKEANEFCDKNGLRYDSHAYEVTLENITLKKFKNGRLDIKGLTEAQEQTINRYLEVKKLLNA